MGAAVRLAFQRVPYQYFVMNRKNPPPYHQPYLDVGSGSVVLLLHGLFGNVQQWKPLVEALKTNFRVIVPRLPLFDVPTENNSVKHLTQVLHDFLEWHQLTDVNLVGHALGGQLAVTYTHRYPHRVNRLVLISSAGLAERNPFINPRDHVHDYDYVHDKVESAFFKREFVSEDFVDEIYATVQNISKRMALDHLMRSARNSGVGSFLHKIDHPVLLVWGLNDNVHVPEQALHFHDLLPNSEIKFIDECGHLPMVEQPTAFVRHVTHFLNELNPLKNWHG
jgi:2-hydroxy-6-oxonona-2,4-dienedioate hydrolase